MTTALGGLVNPTKSRDLLITWSGIGWQIKNGVPNLIGRQLSDKKMLSTKPHNQPFDHVDTSGHMRTKKCISISKRPMFTKLEKMVAYNKETFALLITWSREVTWIITNVILPLPRGLRHMAQELFPLACKKFFRETGFLKRAIISMQ